MLRSRYKPNFVGLLKTYLVRPAEERQWETCVDTLDPGSGQIAVEGRDGLPGLRDLVVVVVVAENYNEIQE